MNAPEHRRLWRPRAGSLSARVIQWFRAQPDEELTAADIAIKFGVPRPENVHGQLAAAVAGGVLERERERDGATYLYRLARQGPRKRLYLSGPMTGRPGLNFPAFHAEAARLRALGYLVVNPAEITPDPAADWHACMRADLRALLGCDAICLLDGWETSAGAHLELHVAHRVGLEVLQAREVVA